MRKVPVALVGVALIGAAVAAPAASGARPAVKVCSWEKRTFLRAIRNDRRVTQTELVSRF